MQAQVQLKPRMCKHAQHKDGPKEIEVLCLEPNCLGERIICSPCFVRHHMGHQYVFRDNDSFQIKQYSDKAIGQEQIKKTESRFNNLNERWNNFSSTLLKNVEQISSFVEQKKKNFENILRYNNEEKIHKSIIFQNFANDEEVNNIIQHLISQDKNKNNLMELQNQVQEMSQIVSNETTIFEHFFRKFFEKLKKVNESIHKNTQNKTPSKSIQIMDIEQSTKKLQKSERTEDLSNNCSPKTKQFSREEYTDTLKFINKDDEHIELQILKARNHNMKIHKIFIDQNSAPYDVPKFIINDSHSIFELKSLEITTNELTSNGFKQLVKHYPNLEELSIRCCQQYSQEAIDTLIKNHPHLRKVHTYYDFHRYFDKYIEFLTFSWEIKKNLLKSSQCKKLSKVKGLQNIEIHFPAQEDMVNVIEQMQSLKEIIIGSFQFLRTCHSKLFKTLEAKTTLRSLAILNIDGHNSHFGNQPCINLWKNNPQLQTLILCRCQFISDRDFQEIAQYCKSLQTLSLAQCNKIGGQKIWTFTSLVNLQIDTCKIFDEIPAIENIDDLTNLEYLCVNLKIKDRQDANKFLEKISHLYKLKYLDINHNNFDDNGFKYLMTLTNLKTLLCGCSSITGQGLIETLQKIQNIEKLSIFSKTQSQHTPIKGFHIRQISAHCKRISHLNIKNIKADFKSIQKFKHLIFLQANESLSLKPIQIKDLQSRGVWLRGIRLKRKDPIKNKKDKKIVGQNGVNSQQQTQNNNQ